MPLYKRPGSPYWWVRVGRKTRRSTGTADRKDAEEFERVLTERLWRAAKLGDRSQVTWDEAAKRWLSDSGKARKRDRWFLDWLAPKIADYPLSAIAHPDAIEELRQDGLADGWSHATVDRMMGTVSAVLRKCVEWRYLEHAPKLPMYRPARAEPRFLTPQQYGKLRAELPEHLALAADVAVHTLLRMRAMLRMTWDRVELDQRRAWIPSSHQKAGRPFAVPLNSEAVKALKALRNLNPDGVHVFQWKGRPIDDCNTRAFQEAVQRAGVAPLRWHDLRHTGASWAVQSGVTLPELMAMGDWKSYAMVLRYAHLAPSQAASAAERVAQWAHKASRRTPAKRAGKAGK